jgi:hypothetical protein
MPTYEEWLSSCFQYICDAYVSCTDGTEQYIKGCSFNYSLYSKEPVITKRGYFIHEFFFVDKVVRIENIRKIK